MKTPRRLPLILLCLAAAAAAQPSASKSKKPAPAAVAEPESGKPSVEDGKTRVEKYLAQRTKKLQDAHAARLAFSSRETLLWEEFWAKDQEARKTFELRTARQTVDLFSTLETLDPKDHASTINDYEKLRGTMVKAFEAQQKQKMQDFFAGREARWLQFASGQESDRAAFAADADVAWQDDKGFLRSIYAPQPLPGSTTSK